MTPHQHQRMGFVALAIVVLVWILGHIFGPALFNNNWSFTQWKYVSIGYVLAWVVLFALATVVALRYTERPGKLASQRSTAVGAVIVIFIVFFIFRFDSILYGGGNLRVGQIANVAKVVFRWYEVGAIAIAAILHDVLKLFFHNDDTAALITWRLFAFASTAVALIGSVQIVRLLAADKVRRAWLFLIIVFGPQVIVYFGFVGIQPAIAAFIVWFAYFALRLDRRYTGYNVLGLWAVAVAGTIFHYTLGFLLPAAVYATLAGVSRKRSGAVAAGLLSVGVLAFLLYLLYSHASESFLFAHNLLFPEGRRPFSDYSLWSPRRIGDIFQFVFLVAPLLIVMKLLAYTSRNWAKDRGGAMTLWWMALGGTVVFLVLNPYNSIVLDLPRLVVYFTPVAILSALLLSRLDAAESAAPKLTAVVAVAMVFIPLAYLPVYLSIAKAETYTTAYFDKHDAYYRIGGMALRDAYFARGEIQKSDDWDSDLQVKSPDVLNLRGCRQLVGRGESYKAITVLNRVVARNPYWTPPRDLLAIAYMKVGRYEEAKPHIDTCLMLDPQIKTHQMNRYIYYRSIGKLKEALRYAREAEEFLPDDSDIVTDEMILSLRTGDTTAALSLAEKLLSEAGDRAYPYYVRGQVSQMRGNLDQALAGYRKFLQYADPNNPDVSRVTELVQELSAAEEP
jgi:tetratricopeptide (TPR) repeat protein